jgi:hypothetical protein
MITNKVRRIWNKIRPKEKKLVAMFHFGRCGSTVIGNILNVHPQIKWDSEVFERVRAGKIEEPDLSIGLISILKNRINKFHKDAYGFETKAFPEEHLRPNVLNMNISQYIDKLIELGFTYFIILKRNNYLRFLTSLYIGWKSETWHVKNNSEFKKEKVTIEPGNVRIGDEYKPSLLQLLKDLDTYYLQIEQELHERKIPFLKLIYEEDIEQNPEIAYNKICKFIKVKEIPGKVIIKKQNPGSLQELIENYDELKSYLNNSNYSWMLKD